MTSGDRPGLSGRLPSPAYDHLREARFILHKCMRVAFEAQERWIVESLEHERENTAAQLAWLIRNGRS